jgi:membrane fusion protein (multidrug efflux system)
MVRYLLPVLSFFLVFSLVGCGSPPAVPVAGPPEVVVLQVIARNIPENATFVGSTVANRTVNLAARVTGTLRERPYVEGAVVAAGAPLFVLDPREFEASVQAAEAQVANAAAQLVKAEADFNRIEPLVKTGVVAQTDLDAKRAAVLMAKAEALGSEAALAQARLNREYATVTAPFAGIIGKASVDPGALVSPSTGTLAVLDQVDPMAIQFTVAESALLKWRKELTSGAIKAPLADQLTLTAQQIDGSIYPQEGHISFRDVRIDSQTGTALIRATFPNAQGQLRAGQFMRVSLSGATRVDAIVIPQAAVVQSPTGASVMVVDAGGKVEARLVELGAWDGTNWVITSGLKSGETIIVEGLQKARHGAVVKATPAAPAAPVAK